MGVFQGTPVDMYIDIHTYMYKYMRCSAIRKMLVTIYLQYDKNKKVTINGGGGGGGGGTALLLYIIYVYVCVIVICIFLKV